MSLPFALRAPQARHRPRHTLKVSTVDGTDVWVANQMRCATNRRVCWGVIGLHKLDVRASAAVGAGTVARYSDCL